MEKSAYISALKAQCEAENVAAMSPTERQLYEHENFLLKNLPDDLAEDISRSINNMIEDVLNQEWGFNKYLNNKNIESPDEFRVKWMAHLYKFVAQTQERAGIAPPPMPFFEVLPTGTCNATVIRMPQSDERIVVFHQGLFTFINSFVKIIITILLESSECLNLLDDSRTREDKALGLKVFLKAFPAMSLRFRDLLKAFVIDGDPERSQPWLLKRSLLPVQEHWLTLCELFILAHECAHIYFEKDDAAQKLFARKTLAGNDIDVLIRNWTEEMMADMWAALVTFDSPDLSVSLPHKYACVELYFWASEIVERCLSVLRVGEIQKTFEILPKKPDSIMHPPPDERRASLRRQFSRNFGPKANALFSIADNVGLVCDALWNSEQYFFLENHLKGVKPAHSWGMLR